MNLSRIKWGAYYRQSPKTVTYRIGHRRKASEGYFTPEQWQALCEIADNKCMKCGRNNIHLSPDHIQPASRGGSTFITNIQVLCVKCNVRKSNLYTTDYRSESIKKWAKTELRKMLDT